MARSMEEIKAGLITDKTAMYRKKGISEEEIAEHIRKKDGFYTKVANIKAKEEKEKEDGTYIDPYVDMDVPEFDEEKYNEQLEQEHYEMQKKPIPTSKEHITWPAGFTPGYNKDEVFEWENRFYLRIQDKPMVFFVMDYDKKAIEEVFVRYNKEDKEYEEARTTTLAKFSIEEITEYKPFTEEAPALYQAKIKMKKGDTKVFQPMNLFELIGELRGIGGAVLKTNQTSDILNRAIALARETGKVIEVKDPPYPGFFWIDGKLVSTRKYDDPSVTEVRKALELLHDFADNFDQFLPQLSYVLHWLLMAPYSFVKKQKGHSDKIGAMYLYGTSRAGKTIYGLLGAHIWNLMIDEFMIAAGALHSPPSFGKKMSESTFPILLDEGESVIDPKGNLSAIFKNAVFYKNVRGRHNPSSGKYENIPALSAPMITSNNSQPTNAALGARLNTLEFTMGKVRTDKEIKEFNNKFDPENDDGKLRALKAIGEFVANYIEANLDILDMPWKEAAKCLWEAVYDYGGQEIPKWLAEIGEADGLSEAYEEEEEEIFIQFRRLVLRKAEVYKGVKDDGSPIPVTAEDKARDVILNSKETWISMVTPTRGKYKGQTFVEIDAGICADLKKECGLSMSFRMLTPKLGGEEKVVRRGTRNVKVGRWLYDDFLKMMKTQEVEEE